MAWFISPISENAHDPDSLNVAAVIGATFGAVVLVAVAKVVPRQVNEKTVRHEP